MREGRRVECWGVEGRGEEEEYERFKRDCVGNDEKINIKPTTEKGERQKMAKKRREKRESIEKTLDTPTHTKMEIKTHDKIISRYRKWQILEERENVGKNIRHKEETRNKGQTGY